jgi:hypothetical protein
MNPIDFNFKTYLRLIDFYYLPLAVIFEFLVSTNSNELSFSFLKHVLLIPVVIIVLIFLHFFFQFLFFFILYPLFILINNLIKKIFEDEREFEDHLFISEKEIGQQFMMPLNCFLFLIFIIVLALYFPYLS